MNPNKDRGTHTPPDGQRFQLLVDAVHDYAICMLDPGGTVSSWNRGARRIEGYEPGEIIGHHFSRFFTPEDQAAGLPAAILAEAHETGRSKRELSRVRKDGTRFRAATVIRPVRDATGRLIGFAEVTHDITERVAAQQALRDSERRFRLLLENVVDYAIFMLDPSGVVTNWNAGAQRMKGYTADEIIGQHFARFYTKEDRLAGLPMRVLDTAAREGRFEAEGWRVRKDGSRFWASMVVDPIRTETGELLGFAKVTRDITERRMAQDVLRESERLFRLLVTGVSDYALFMLDPNGIVTNWNIGAERIKGYTAAEIVGHHFSRFYTAQDRAAGKPARALEIAAREGRYESEGWRVRKDGSQFWANVVLDAIREDGVLVGFAKITRDITERREAQKALEKAEAQRTRVQRIEALGQLTGGVAHDFNNLLMIVSGHVQTLKKFAKDDPRAARSAGAIELAAKRGESLTRQLLTFSRRQTLNPVVIDIGERVEALRTMLESSVGASATLAVSVPPGVWRVRVDASEFELALLNLALNSRDAMPGGGLITIVAENAPLEPTEPPHNLSGDFVAITVADTGTGIPPDVLPKVFDPFFTTNECGHGTGLGLSQVHGFAHQSGGSVSIESSLGNGTRVTLFLPRTAEAPTREPAETPVDVSAGGVALLVEDNPEVAEVTGGMLRELGYQVRPARDARAGLALVEADGIDLVVSDVVMPGGMDGFDLARQIRERRPDLPILLVTGYSEVASRAHSEFTVLRKPFQLGELSRAVGRAADSRRRFAQDNLIQLPSTRHRPRREPETP